MKKYSARLCLARTVDKSTFVTLSTVLIRRLKSADFCFCVIYSFILLKYSCPRIRTCVCQLYIVLYSDNSYWRVICVPYGTWYNQTLPSRLRFATSPSNWSGGFGLSRDYYSQAPFFFTIVKTEVIPLLGEMSATADKRVPVFRRKSVVSVSWLRGIF